MEQKKWNKKITHRGFEPPKNGSLGRQLIHCAIAAIVALGYSGLFQFVVLVMSRKFSFWHKIFAQNFANFANFATFEKVSKLKIGRFGRRPTALR